MIGRLLMTGDQGPPFSLGACLTLGLILTACISDEVNLFDERRMTIEAEGPQEVEISISAVVEELDALEIRGYPPQKGTMDDWITGSECYAKHR